MVMLLFAFKLWYFLIYIVGRATRANRSSSRNPCMPATNRDSKFPKQMLASQFEMTTGPLRVYLS
jgi:hypothetical protein